MRIAITGASGFIGRHLVEEARRRGHSVLAVVRPTHPAEPLLALGADVARADLGAVGEPGPSALDEALEGADALIHSAARVSWGTPEAFARDSVMATREVIGAARRAAVRRLVHVSSTAVYGDRAVERGVVREEAPYGYKVSRWDRYARAKIEAEKVALDAARAVERLLEVVVVRPGWVIGEGDRSTGALLGGLRAGKFPLVGRGENRLPLTYVKSVTAACLEAATRADLPSGRTYNVACDFEVTQRDFFDALAAAAGLEPRYLRVPFAVFYGAGVAFEALAQLVPGLDPKLSRNVAVLLGRDSVFDTTRARAELGWTPAAPLETVLERIVASLSKA